MLTMDFGTVKVASTTLTQKVKFVTPVMRKWIQTGWWRIQVATTAAFNVVKVTPTTIGDVSNSHRILMRLENSWSLVQMKGRDCRANASTAMQTNQAGMLNKTTKHNARPECITRRLISVYESDFQIQNLQSTSNYQNGLWVDPYPRLNSLCGYYAHGLWNSSLKKFDWSHLCLHFCWHFIFTNFLFKNSKCRIHSLKITG